MAETDVIRTPDQRVRVFVSSTLQELAAEREAARDAVTRLRLVPVWLGRVQLDALEGDTTGMRNCRPCSSDTISPEES